MRKQYTGIPLSRTDPGLKGRDKDWIPYVKIRVSANHQSTPMLHAVIDSGASYCLFRADVADFLHIDLTKAPTASMGGVIGGPKDTVYFHAVNVVIENNWTINIFAGFMKKLSVPALLGRVGFFDKFQVLFDHQPYPPEFELTKIELIN